MAIEVAFLGALSRDAERKTSAGGKDYLRLNIRVGDGDNAQWVTVMAFDPDAISAADKLTKGASVYVEGRLSVNEWTGSDGKKRLGLSVMGSHCRPAQIGRNRKPPKASADRKLASVYAPCAASSADLNDEIPF